MRDKRIKDIRKISKIRYKYNKENMNKNEKIKLTKPKK